jgi:hypothetical protein
MYPLGTLNFDQYSKISGSDASYPVYGTIISNDTWFRNGNLGIGSNYDLYLLGAGNPRTNFVINTMKNINETVVIGINLIVGMDEIGKPVNGHTLTGIGGYSFIKGNNFGKNSQAYGLQFGLGEWFEAQAGNSENLTGGGLNIVSYFVTDVGLFKTYSGIRVGATNAFPAKANVSKDMDIVTSSNIGLNESYGLWVGKPYPSSWATDNKKQVFVQGTGNYTGIFFGENFWQNWTKIYSPTNSTFAIAIENGSNLAQDVITVNLTNTIIRGNTTQKGNLNVTGNLSWYVPYATLIDNVTQQITSTTAFMPINFSQSADGMMVNLTGAGIYNGHNLSVSVAGDYLVVFSAMMQCTGGSPNLFQIWSHKNGVNIPVSNTQMTITSNNQYYLMTVNFILDLVPTDKFGLLAWADDTNCRLINIAPSTAPERPAVPSVILTINKIGDDI